MKANASPYRDKAQPNHLTLKHLLDSKISPLAAIAARAVALTACFLVFPSYNLGAAELNFALHDERLDIKNQNTTIAPANQEASDETEMAAIVFQPSASPALLVSPRGSRWNWPADGSLRLQVQNIMPWPVTLQVQISSAEASLRTTLGIPPGPPLTVSIPLTEVSPRNMGMHVGPPMPISKGGDTVLVATSTEGHVDPGQVSEIKLSMPQPVSPQTLLIGKMEAVRGTADIYAAYSNIVDKYGQFTRSTWPEKIATDIELIELANADPETNSTAGLDQYGGRTDLPRMEASGFFRTQKHGDRWWLVTPEGYPFFSLGVNAVNLTDGRTYIQDREFMFENRNNISSKYSGSADSRSDNGSQRDNNRNYGKWWDIYSQNVALSLGDNFEAAWRERSLKRLKSWHFNTLGNWSDPGFMIDKGIAYTVPISIYGEYSTIETGYDYWGRMPDPFDPRFAKATEKAVAISTKGKQYDPWLLGYFADNELAWAGQGPQGRWAIPRGTLSQSAESPAKQAFLAYLRETYGDAENLAKAWGVNIKSFEQLLNEKLAAPEPVEAYPAIAEDYSAFLKIYAAKYFTTVIDCLKKADPNHMFLGGRLAVRTPEVEEMSAKYADITSINTYSVLPEHGFDVKAFQHWDKPVMLTEWHLGSSDRGPFGGGVVSVESEAERGKAYTRFIESATSKNIIVGAHWFQYADQPVTGRLIDGENSHVGLVGITDIPFAEFTRDVTQANIRAGGGSMPKSNSPN